MNLKKLDRNLVLCDYAECCFGKDFVWDVAVSASCRDNPQLWRSPRQMSKVACIVLSMPATASVIERCNKMYASTRTKLCNRLTCSGASKLATVAYNPKVQNSQAIQSDLLNVLSARAFCHCHFGQPQLGM